MTAGDQKDRRGIFQRYGRDIFFMVSGAVLGAIFGAVLGHALDPFSNSIWDWMKESRCDAKAHIKEAKSLRQRAIELESNQSLDRSLVGQIESLHQRANAELKIPADCGNPLAEAHLGLAYCFGWGVKSDRPAGLAMLRDAAKNDAGLAEWTGYCP